MIFRVLFIIVLSLNTMAAFSQQYDSLVRKNAVWIIESYYNDLNGGITNYWGYYMNGDTLINSNSYKKLYKLYSHPDLTSGFPVWFPFKVDSIKLIAFAREESKKIYAIQKVNDGNMCSENNEFVLFDYNYMIGDTADLCVNYENSDTISSIGFDNQFNRKTYIIKNELYYIEGIGSSKGLFENVVEVIGGYTRIYDYCLGDLDECNIINSIKKKLLFLLSMFFPIHQMDI